jgi:predicted nucleic acid-binding protein
MAHVFVESNWLFAYAAPAHHKDPAATELLDRARSGEFTMHMPNICIGEARQAIMTKCQPRKEADAIRRYLSWSEPAGHVAPADAAAARTVLMKYESAVRSALDNLSNVLRGLAQESNLKIFGLDDRMPDLGTQLALDGIAAKPFDHAILAGVLVSASRLWETGERGISFCEADADLQPWDRYGNIKPPLMSAYDKSHIWVYGDFLLADPPRDPGFH